MTQSLRQRDQVAQSRTGKSLIEMLVVIITMSAILTTAGQMLHRLSRAERSIRESSAIARSEMRLFRIFRADARQADHAETDSTNDRQRLVLTSASGTVAYEAHADQIERVSDKANATHRDIFRLGPVTAEFVVENDRLAVLAVSPRRQTTSFPKAAAGQFEIVAALGTESSQAASDSAVEPGSGLTPVEAPRPGDAQPEEASPPDEEASL